MKKEFKIRKINKKKNFINAFISDFINDLKNFFNFFPTFLPILFSFIMIFNLLFLSTFGIWIIKLTISSDKEKVFRWIEYNVFDYNDKTKILIEKNFKDKEKIKISEDIIQKLSYYENNIQKLPNLESVKVINRKFVRKKDNMWNNLKDLANLANYFRIDWTAYRYVEDKKITYSIHLYNKNDFIIDKFLWFWRERKDIDVFWHELGHIFHFNNEIFEKKDTKIYKQLTKMYNDWICHITNYSKTNIEEFFAENFWYIYTNGWKKWCPEFKKVLDEYIKQL